MDCCPYSQMLKRKKDDIQIMTQAIIEAHDGKAYFTLGETAKIIGCGANNAAHYLHNSGIIVKKIGIKKLVSALDIATMMHYGRIAPIDNTSRGLMLE